MKIAKTHGVKLETKITPGKPRSFLGKQHRNHNNEKTYLVSWREVSELFNFKHLISVTSFTKLTSCSTVLRWFFCTGYCVIQILLQNKFNLWSNWSEQKRILPLGLYRTMHHLFKVDVTRPYNWDYDNVLNLIADMRPWHHRQNHLTFKNGINY